MGGATLSADLLRRGPFHSFTTGVGSRSMDPMKEQKQYTIYGRGKIERRGRLVNDKAENMPVAVATVTLSEGGF